MKGKPTVCCEFLQAKPRYANRLLTGGFFMEEKWDELYFAAKNGFESARGF